MNQLLKQILIFCLILYPFHYLMSQESDETIAPKNYLGKLNGQPIYYTGLSHIRTNIITLYTIENETISELDIISLPEDRFEQIFLFENQIYGVVSDLNETIYSLIKLNNRFKEVQRVKIMSYSDPIKNPNLRLSPVTHRLKIITHPGKILLHVEDAKIRMAVVDLKEMESKVYDFEVPLASSFEPADALFFNETDAHVVLEYLGPSLQTRRRYATLINGITNSFVLNEFIQPGPGVATSFRFVEANNRNYLVSTLYNGTKQIGFTITNIKGMEITEMPMNKVINEKLNDPLLWSKKSYKKWKHKSFHSLFELPRLDEVHFINNQLIISVRYFNLDAPSSNIVISSVNIENEESPYVNWNVMTHNGLFNNSQYHFNQFSHEYVLVPLDNHLRLFYQCDKKSISEDGSVVKKRKETNYLNKGVQVAILDIDLKDGSLKYIINPFIKNESSFLSNPYFCIMGKTIYIVSDSMKYYGPRVTTKEIIFHYKPSLLAFPID